MRSIDAVAFAEVLDALPARLRKRLDAAVERAADWAREPDPAGGGESVRVDDETTVTLRLTAGVVRAAADVACNCLLAPACLHRAAVAASLRIHDPDTAHEPEVQTPETPPEGETAAVVAETVAEPVAAESAPTATLTAAATTATATSTATAMPNPVPLTVRERVALEALWDSAAAVLVAGLVGANLFTEAELARATHQVRALRLHRAAALGARVVAGLRVARERRVEHRLEQYTADLRELLLTTHQLTHTTDPADLAELRGISRRSYSEHASMRLYGLFTEPVVARSGHAGVVGYAVDGSGVVWSSASIAPGGFELVRPSYDSALKLGGTTLTQRELGRHGLLVSGASSSRTAGWAAAGRPRPCARPVSPGARHRSQGSSMSRWPRSSPARCAPIARRRRTAPATTSSSCAPASSGPNGKGSSSNSKIRRTIHRTTRGTACEHRPASSVVWRSARLPSTGGTSRGSPSRSRA